jgi:hypothetical protein
LLSGYLFGQRFIDYVPLAIENELNQALAFGIEELLFRSIFEDSDRGRLDLQDILTEDPALASRRKELGDKKARLLQIEKKLDTFMLKSQLTDHNEYPILTSPHTSSGPTFRPPCQNLSRI